MSDADYLRAIADGRRPPGGMLLRLRAIADRIEAAERDAGRYRFIRDKSDALQAIGRQHLMLGNFEEELDAAIDKAMKAKP